MMRPTARPGTILFVGLLIVVATALLPAGASGRGVPAASWAAWTVVLAGSVFALRRAAGGLAEAIRKLGWLVPAVFFLSLPLAFFASMRRDPEVAGALLFRSFTAACAALVIVETLGPSGLVRAASDLGVPPRLVETFHAMLVALHGMHRQVAAMLRARAARRPGGAAWSSLLFAPVDTATGFGRFAAALLLRALERAEALERAREARRGGDA